MTDSFFEDTLQDGYFDNFVKEANSVFKRFETRPSACALCSVPYRTLRAGAELDFFTSFSVCMFKLRFGTASTQLSFSLCLNALSSFECLHF